MSTGTEVVCRRCGTVGEPDDSFCEACGAPMTRPPRTDVDLGVVAGVSDRGLSRSRNEDAVRVATVGSALIAVVCDGVASSEGGALAAEAAAEAACAFLVDVLGSRREAGDWDPAAAMSQAVSAAQEAVLEVPSAWDAADPPSCTIVAALWDGEALTVGSVGDSRVYWVGPAGARLLSVDDSWAQDRIAAGALSGVDAWAAPQAHAITRWLGRDAPDGPWRVDSIVPAGRGRVVLCSDGLWNYAPSDDRFGALVSSAPAGAPIAVAHWLADAAITAGGADNVTVAVAEIRPASEPGEEPTA